MFYKVYTTFCKCKDGSLWIGAFSVDEGEDDVIAKCLKADSNFAARLTALYESTLSARPLSKEIINILSHEGEKSIKELKRGALRLTFFIDQNLPFRDIQIQKAIVCLSRFVKKTQKTPPEEIDKAQGLRELFLEAKKEGNLKIIEG